MDEVLATRNQASVRIKSATRWIVPFLVLLSMGIMAGNCPADDGPACLPPSIKPEDILPGVVKQCSFSQIAISPGTQRDVAVFIPARLRLRQDRRL